MVPLLLSFARRWFRPESGFLFPCIFNDYRKTNTNIFHTEDAEKKSHADLADLADFLTTNDRTRKSQKKTNTNNTNNTNYLTRKALKSRKDI